MAVSRREIGDLLVDNGVITPEELERVRFEREKTGHSFPHILSRLGLAGENQLKNALELEYGVNFVALRKMEPDLELIGMLPEAVMWQHMAVPIARDGNRLTVAMVDPSNSAALDDLKKRLTGLPVKTVVCLEDDFETFLKLAYQALQAADGSNGAAGQSPANPQTAPVEKAVPIEPVATQQSAAPAAQPDYATSAQAPIPSESDTEQSVQPQTVSAPFHQLVRQLAEQSASAPAHQSALQQSISAPQVQQQSAPAQQEQVSAQSAVQQPSVSAPQSAVQQSVPAPESAVQQPSVSAPESAVQQPSVPAPESAVQQPSVSAPESAVHQPSVPAPESAVQQPSVPAPESAVHQPSVPAPEPAAQQQSVPAQESAVSQPSVPAPEPADNTSTTETPIFDASQQQSFLDHGRRAPVQAQPSAPRGLSEQPAETDAQGRTSATSTGSFPTIDVSVLGHERLGIDEESEAGEGEQLSLYVLARKAQEEAIVLLANQILGGAIKRHCSNIHIVAGEKQALVQYRLNGMLYVDRKLPCTILMALIARYKMMARMNIGEQSLPQDGHIKVKSSSKEIVCLISTIPGQHGENVVIWIL